MTPYRIAAPPEPELPEAEEPFVIALRADERRARLLGMTMAFGAVCVSFLLVGELKERKAQHREVAMAAERAGAIEAIATARDRAWQEQVAFEREAMRAVERGVDAAPAAGSCPMRFPGSDAIARGRAPFPLLVADRVDLGERLPSQTVARVLADLNRAESLKNGGRFEEARIVAESTARADSYGYEVVFVTSGAKRPQALSGQSYVAGTLEGRAYVYDFVERTIVCAGDVSARSSSAIDYAWASDISAPPSRGQLARMSDAVEDDLRWRLTRAIASAVRWRAR